jgi:hypothetical protein
VVFVISVVVAVVVVAAGVAAAAEGHFVEVDVLQTINREEI